MLDALAEGQAKMNREVHAAKLAALLTRYASERELAEANDFFAKYKGFLPKHSLVEIALHIADLEGRAAQQKAPGETK